MESQCLNASRYLEARVLVGIVVACLALGACRERDEPLSPPKGVSPTRSALSLENSLQINGILGNGTYINGLGLNNLSPNGISFNSLPLNGLPLNGLSV